MAGAHDGGDRWQTTSGGFVRHLWPAFLKGRNHEELGRPIDSADICGVSDESDEGVTLIAANERA
jgi:hypothetical protein